MTARAGDSSDVTGLQLPDPGLHLGKINSHIAINNADLNSKDGPALDPIYCNKLCQPFVYQINTRHVPNPFLGIYLIYFFYE